MSTILSFAIEEHRFALPISDIWSVIRMVDLAQDSGEYPGSTGTINFHGKIIPVYSVRRLSGIPDRRLQVSDVLIIIRQRGEYLALWADMITGIEDLTIPEEPVSDTEPEPGFTGVYYTGDGTGIITNPAQFIAGIGAKRRSVGNKRTGNEVDTATVQAIQREADTAGFAGINSILRNRADLLARPEEENHPEVIVELLRFGLMYQEYAVEMKYVREVILTGEITPVPVTPDYIAGICTTRGEIISLVDLRALFSLPERDLTDLNRVFVITNGTITFGILADTITGVDTIPLEKIEPAPPGFTSIGDEYLKGVTGGNLVILDAAAILADPRMIIDESD